jgi:hypothetical protein
MSKKLAGFVAVHDDDGKAHLFGPDDNVPAWAVKKITNPNAWEAGETPASEETPQTKSAPKASAKEKPAKGKGKAATAAPAASSTEDSGTGDEDEETEESDTGEGDGTASEEAVEIPPQGGPKATVDAWTEYAKAVGFEIEGEPTRKEIIEALDAAGVATK